jgi:uncharacterized protein (TIGR00251 family)
VKPFLREHAEGTLLFIKAQPRASKNEIGEAVGAELKIKVTAPPVDSAANRAIIELLAETLGCGKSAVQLIRGETSRHKCVLVRGLNSEQVEKGLGV